MSSKEKENCIKLDKEIYGKKAVILSVYDHLDDIDVLISSTEKEWVVTYTPHEKSTFTKEGFMKTLNANVAREIIEERTGDMRTATYIAAVNKKL